MEVNQERKPFLWVDRDRLEQARRHAGFGCDHESLVETPVSELIDGGTTSVPANLSTRPSVYTRRNGGKKYRTSAVVESIIEPKEILSV